MPKQTPQHLPAVPNKPTIAHMLPWPSIGGVEVATLRLMAATRGEFRHVAFCISGSDPLGEACREVGAEVVGYEPPEPSLRHGGRYLRASRLVADELRRQRADLVHCSEIKATYHCSLAALLARVPLISHVRSRYSVVSLREKLTFLPVRRFVFVSNDTRRHFGLKVGDKRASVLYDGISFPNEPIEPVGLRREMEVAENTSLVGMVARLNPQKDYDTLVEAAALVLAQRPAARFVVIGDNSRVELNRIHFAHVAARLQTLGIADRFFFTGFRADVPGLVEDLDIVVLCTHREGLPLSLLEAMGQGKPVIATDVDGVPELVSHGITGLLHAHGDARGLAAMILQCLADPAYARVLGQAAQRHIREHFNQDIFARNAAELYRHVLAPDDQTA